MLVVDDNRDAADSLAVLLKVLRHQAEAVYSGSEALGAAPRFRPDMVLLDLGMPAMNGYDLAARLRADPALAGAVLVAVSGWGADADRARSRAAGIHHHLTKPVELDQLAALLNGRVNPEA